MFDQYKYCPKLSTCRVDLLSQCQVVVSNKKEIEKNIEYYQSIYHIKLIKPNFKKINLFTSNTQ